MYFTREDHNFLCPAPSTQSQLWITLERDTLAANNTTMWQAAEEPHRLSFGSIAGQDQLP